MSQVVRISDENWERLKKWAVPLEDSVDDALGKALDAAEPHRSRFLDEQPSSNDSILGQNDSTNSSKDTGNSGERTISRRRRKGQKIPQAAYEIPILESIDKLGGKAKAGDVLDELERRMKPLFGPVDYAKTGTEARWRNTARWARAALIEQNLIKANSKRGIWELTQKGLAEARSRNR